MILNNNFTSITYLGNFNPNILTEKFLTDNEILGFLAEPIKTKTTSLASSIEYKDISIISDLKSFTVIEKKIDDFTKARNVAIASRYIDLIKYTPIKSSGLNLNANLRLPDIEDIVIMLNLPGDINGFFGSESYTVSTARSYAKKDSLIMSVSLSAKLSHNTAINMGIKRIKDDIFNYNYNFFVSLLDKDPENIGYIPSNHKAIVSKFCGTINRFFKK